MTKKMKPLYATTTANDATSTGSYYQADMKKTSLPEYIVFSRFSFPVICRDFEHALDFARRQSKFDNNIGETFKVFNVGTGTFVSSYTNGVESHMRKGGAQ